MNSEYESAFGSYRTRKFTDIFGSADEFINCYKELEMHVSSLDENDIKTIFYLLYAKYGNSHIANNDETQFKFKVMSIIYTDGALWKQKRKIHEKLTSLDLDSDEVLVGTAQIQNMAQNPAIQPSTASLEELQYINSQMVNKTKRNVINALALLNEELGKDYTEVFIKKFSGLFLKIVNPQLPLWYITDTEEE